MWVTLTSYKFPTHNASVKQISKVAHWPPISEVVVSNKYKILALSLSNKVDVCELGANI